MGTTPRLLGNRGIDVMIRLITRILGTIVLCAGLWAAPAISAPYAAFVMDARTGKVLHSRNADTRLHPASLTKMMTLYITFQAIDKGEITLDTYVKISRNAASEVPSKLGLRAGSEIKLRYLIRGAAVKSANDAATAIAEAISGSEAEFAKRMTLTARAMGMKRTTFRNAHGLTHPQHLSTARDMSILGRHILYDYPQYYNLFSRRTTDAGIRTVTNTNSRMLNSYRGIDGIKTGYTRAAGSNLVASARRGNERVIATVFGGRSVATRNARVAELLDMGFKRAPTHASLRKPRKPRYIAPSSKAGTHVAAAAPAGKTMRTVTAIKRSIRPKLRPFGQAQEPALVAAATGDIEKALVEAAAASPNAVSDAVQNSDALLASITPRIRPSDLVPETATSVAVAQAVAMPTPTPPAQPARVLSLTAIAPAATPSETLSNLETISRVPSGETGWGITVGQYPSEHQASRVLVRMAMIEASILTDAQRHIKRRGAGHEAMFFGLTQAKADLACRKLQAQQFSCFTINPN